MRSGSLITRQEVEDLLWKHKIEKQMEEFMNLDAEEKREASFKRMNEKLDAMFRMMGIDAATEEAMIAENQKHYLGDGNYETKVDGSKKLNEEENKKPDSGDDSYEAKVDSLEKSNEEAILFRTSGSENWYPIEKATEAEQHKQDCVEGHHQEVECQVFDQIPHRKVDDLEKLNEEVIEFSVMTEKADHTQRLWEFPDEYVMETTDGSSGSCLSISRVDGSVKLLDDIPHYNSLHVPKIRTIFGVVTFEEDKKIDEAWDEEITKFKGGTLCDQYGDWRRNLESISCEKFIGKLFLFVGDGISDFGKYGSTGALVETAIEKARTTSKSWTELFTAFKGGTESVDLYEEDSVLMLLIPDYVRPAVSYTDGVFDSRFEVLPVYTLDAEFARPLWIFGMDSYESFQDNEEEKPPLVLESHGGPTAEISGVLDLIIQYWTSHGWAFVDVDYGGSTDYGRAYRERLLGQWSVVAVTDCCSCTKFLVESGKALVLSNSGKRIDQVGKKKYVKQVMGRHNDTELHLAAQRGDFAAVKQMLDDIDNQMVGTLSEADFDQEVAEIKASVVNDVNELGETALYTAADRGHLDVVKELLKYSNIETLTKKNRSGFDVLHIAANQGPHAIVQVLLDHDPTLSNTVGTSHRANELNQPRDELRKTVTQIKKDVSPESSSTLPKLDQMANLCVVGGYAVNGVAEIHSDIVKEEVFNDFYELWPEKFQNKTNGVTSRRWRRAKRSNKNKFASCIKQKTRYFVNADAIFDVQIKRIHEYKRQLLNRLGVVFHYKNMKEMTAEERKTKYVPRVCIFGGKAIATYMQAKRIVKFSVVIGDTINHDQEIGSLLKFVFIPDYNVSVAEWLIPASEFSQHITAEMEASGTSNMKFAMNGCILIGTLDGANVEIREEVEMARTEQGMSQEEASW